MGLLFPSFLEARDVYPRTIVKIAFSLNIVEVHTLFTNMKSDITCLKLYILIFDPAPVVSKGFTDVASLIDNASRVVWILDTLIKISRWKLLFRNFHPS